MEGGEEEQRRFRDRHGRWSPWPPFVAVGLVLAEVGVLFGSVPVTVGGFVLLAASVVGILRESSFARSRWRPALGLALAYATAGGLLVGLTTATLRGWAVLAAAGIVGAGAVGLRLVESGRG